MALLSRLVEDLRSQHPDHVAVTGDLVNIGMPVEFRRAAAWMETLGLRRRRQFRAGQSRRLCPGGDADADDDLPALDDRRFVRVELSLPARARSGRGRRPQFRRSTAPLMATGRLGPRQLEGLAALLDETGGRGCTRGSCSSTIRRSQGAPPLRGLTDAAAFERVVRDHGAEAILHGHTHKQLVRSLPSRAAKTVGGRVPVLGAPSAAAATRDPALPRRLSSRPGRSGRRPLAGQRPRPGSGSRQRGDRRARGAGGLTGRISRSWRGAGLALAYLAADPGNNGEAGCVGQPRDCGIFRLHGVHSRAR